MSQTYWDRMTFLPEIINSDITKGISHGQGHPRAGKASLSALGLPQSTASTNEVSETWHKEGAKMLFLQK